MTIRAALDRSSPGEQRTVIGLIWQSDFTLVAGVMLGLAATAVAILRDTTVRLGRSGGLQSR